MLKFEVWAIQIKVWFSHENCKWTFVLAFFLVKSVLITACKNSVMQEWRFAWTRLKISLALLSDDCLTFSHNLWNDTKHKSNNQTAPRRHTNSYRMRWTKGGRRLLKAYNESSETGDNYQSPDDSVVVSERQSISSSPCSCEEKESNFSTFLKHFIFTFLCLFFLFFHTANAALQNEVRKIEKKGSKKQQQRARSGNERHKSQDFKWQLDFLLPFIILIATIFKLINSPLEREGNEKEMNRLESFLCCVALLRCSQHKTEKKAKPVENELFNFYLSPCY